MHRLGIITFIVFLHLSFLTGNLVLLNSKHVRLLHSKILLWLYDIYIYIHIYIYNIYIYIYIYITCV